ncbi:MAG TPA: recombinase [Flavobacterium sp.]|nr:recombinase [Flavobacterium sp.]
MTVYVRKRALKEKGRFALYLELYSNKTQWQENLKLYLEPEKSNSTIKQMNKQTMEIAEKIRVERLYRLQNEGYGYKKPTKTYQNFNKFFLELWEERQKNGVNFGSWDSVYKHLNNFNKNISFTEIDERLMEQFKTYLLSKVKVNSASQYFNIFKHSIHESYRKKLIRDNPADRVKCIREVETHREYLTKEEIQKLINTECRYEVLKRAFLFSCFTGLRWSDINKLTWKEVRLENGVYSIVYTQKKTKHFESLPISANAVHLMGERKEDEERVFKGLKYSDYFNTALLRWCLKAGITKHITFHCGRHTAAIMLLNNDVDIYTVSKILGHKELKTTSIYAKVLNDTKIEAVNKLPVFEF